ncbi:interleukin-31 receptor subunit alpha-like isoform X1 [Seriola dumerili]|uniref:interleukin-31 receptor subunit alpha-like isoform X1 n=1 Tax=Seriola dumerili TaxID=41447 RepID=UPI000BBF052A|nr:interleukin-31 receptor subunit alpha-like isoform X1 [Seriola dumerili]
MVARGFQFDFFNSKCSSCAGHSHLFILGLILVYYTTASSHVHAFSVSCKSKKILSDYQHCQLQPDGVHDLNCFGKYIDRGLKTCVWRPGNHTSKKTYTLIIQQHSQCKAYKNISTLSESVAVFAKQNMTAEVFEKSESRNCTKAVFRASPNSILRCGPPDKVSFSRQFGKLSVTVSWQEDDQKVIEFYSVRYKAVGSLLWSEHPVQSQNAGRCTVKNLNSSLVYSVQIQCVSNEKCSQCPWSQTYTVPSELTTQPVDVSLTDTDIGEKIGKRLLSLNWKLSAVGLYDGFSVTVGKTSGERPCERMNTAQPEIRLILSYSSYHLNISAVNNASTSPALSLTIPQREDIPSIEDGKMNITVHSNTSFTVSWKDDLIKTYVCYCVEWRKNGHKTNYKSFYQNEKNNRTLSLIGEPLEPYERYSITLHTRPEKETCNMKYINNSESTYGRTQFYFIEGSPVSAPTNISTYNVTLDSAGLQWLSIPEDDLRGFLLGYIIHYVEYDQRGTSTEKLDVTVDPKFDTYELGDLKEDAAYQVQISGFTKAGAGVRSTPYVFKTNQQGYFDVNRAGLISIFVVAAVVLIFGSPIIKRAKVILWPSIPNPENSNAMQKIERPCEMELLESISALKVVEWDTNSLQIVEKEAVLTSMLPLHHNSEDEGDSPETTGNWIQRDSEDATGDSLPHDTSDTFSNVEQTNFQSSTIAFSSGYTTMEMFQQVRPQANTAITPAMESDPEDTHEAVVKSGLAYVRQFSTSPILGSEEMTMIS